MSEKKDYTLKKNYYQLYYKLMSTSLWFKSIYKSNKPMTRTYLSPIIFSMRKFANKILHICDEMEKTIDGES